MWKDFKAFAFKGNVIDLAVGVVLGAAFTAVVTAVVNGIIMPVVGLLTPGDTWKDWTVWRLQLGVVLASLLNFLIVAAVLFVVVSKFIKALQRKDVAPATPVPPTPTEQLLTEIRDILRNRP